MRAVVTGGAGFLGSHLVDALLSRGDTVVCLDNLLTGSEANLREASKNPRLTFVRADVTEPLSVDGAVDFIFHLASPASPADYLKYPIQTLKVGALGTHKALGLARAKGARFLLASTSEVYGEPAVHPQTESYWGNVNPIGRRGVYDEAKRFAEAMTMAYHRFHGVATRIVRIFNTYGPRMRLDDGRVMPNFVQMALAGEDLLVYGDGTQTRSFCYVDDLIDGLLRLSASGEVEPVNLGNPEEVSIRELAEEIIRAAGSKSRLRFLPPPAGYEDDPSRRRPDIAKSRRLLGWEPKVGRAEGLRRTLAAFRRGR